MSHEAIISTALRIDPFGADGTLYKMASNSTETLAAFVAAFVADEREACATTCEGISHMASSNAPVLCAMKIRARSRQAALTAPAAEVPEAMKVVTSALLNDPDYAWAWHCNIAMAAHDEGLSHYAANKAAARFLRVLVPGLDTSKHPGFPTGHDAAEMPDAMLPGLLWKDDGVMSVNAELGLSIDQLVKLARAIRPLLTAATPVPLKIAATVPERIAPQNCFDSPEHKASETAYCNGWNDCRQRMLTAAPQAPAASLDAGVVRDAERWRKFVSLDYKVRREWAANLSLTPVLTEWVDALPAIDAAMSAQAGKGGAA